MATTSFQGGGYPGRPYGSFAGRAPFVPPVVVAEERSGGGIPAKRRRERLYINIDGRIVFFKNEESARDYLRSRGDELVERVQREVAQAQAVVEPAEPDAPVQTPELPHIKLPKIEVRGSDEAQAIATDIQLRMHAVLLSLKWHDRLRREEELLLLS